VTITAADIDEMIAFLAAHPEYRDRFRPVVVGEEILSLPSRMDRVEAALLSVSERLDRLTDRFDRLTERVDQMSVDIRALTAKLDQYIERTDSRLNRLDGHMSNMRASLLELLYAKNAGNWFGALIWPVEVVFPRRLTELNDAVRIGALSAADLQSIMAADMIVRGKRRDDAQQETYVVAEISGMVQVGDVRRAAERAGILRRAGMDAIPFVGGNAIDIEAADAAKAEGVHVDLHTQ
jgi:hypothetical protein